MSILRVIPIAGEPTRFHVESATARCANCGALASRDKAEPGSQCDKCGGVMEERWWLVDVAEMPPVGQCSCERFSFDFGPNVRRAMARGERINPAEFRCKHILAARDAALDATLRGHEAGRMEAA